MIHVTQGKLHWNYFLALERDMEALSRYIEFVENNFSTYSIELAHLLFAASSEVDVICKALCKIVSPQISATNINQYRETLVAAMPDIPSTDVFVPRYGLAFKPWEKWQAGENPNWWNSYNNVKHERDNYFHEATLQNALNSLGGLLVMIFHFYRLTLPGLNNPPFPSKKTMLALLPQSDLLRLHESNYYESIVV